MLSLPMRKNVSDVQNFCFILNEDVVRLFESLFLKHDLHIGISVTTLDGSERLFENSDGFLRWAQHPHKPIVSLLFSTPISVKNFQALLSFSNKRRAYPFDFEEKPTIFWSMKGNPDVVDDINEKLKDLVLNTKQGYSFLFGNSLPQNLVFSILSLYLPLFVSIAFGFALTVNLIIGSSNHNFEPKYFKLPNGQILEAMPAIPLDSEAGSKIYHVGFWKYVGIPYIIFFLCLRFARRFYPVGVFDFGYDKIVMSSRFALRDKLVWGLIIGGVGASITAAMIINYFS